MRLRCISIQQPFADLVFAPAARRKRVENRSWRINDVAGPLAIQASKNLSFWRSLTEEEQRKRIPHCPPEGPATGVVIGVVRLAIICRARKLPDGLRDHEHVNRHPSNWCWVFERPARLPAAVTATGNARIFYVEVPDELLPNQVLTKGR